MTDDARARYQRVKAILVDALALDPDARTAFVAATCGDDHALRDEVMALLARESESRPILDQGPLHTEAGETIRAAVDAIERKQRPDTIGGYEIVDVLGEGGMGIVYHGRQHEPLERDVAIKVIRRGMATDRVIARFEWERRSLARMDHPHIAAVIDAGVDDAGHPYVVMQLTPGEPFTRFCDARRMDLERRLKLFLQVCRAVQHAHDRGILHRDLKPSNILVREVDGTATPAVIDFGIAKALDPESDTDPFLTAEGQRIGTPAYMSPEQLRGDLARIDVRSDVYALGIILYELLAGTHPFGEAASELDEEARRRARETRAPSTSILGDDEAEELAGCRGTTARRLRRLLAGDLDMICLMAIRPEPERRYGSVAALAEDVERYLDRRPVLARPDSASYRFQKLVRRHPVRVALVGASLLFVLVSAGALFVHAERLETERDRARAAELRATREARSAAEMAGFLEGLFTQVDPHEGGEGEVTAREILEQGAARVRADLGAEPLVSARFLEVIAGVHHSLGLHQKARELALETLVTLDGVSDPDSAAMQLRLDTLYTLSATSYDLGEIADAEDYDRRALALAREHHGEESGAVAYALSNLALSLQAQGRVEEAVEILEESIRIGTAAHGPDDPDVAWARTNLGYLLHQQGRYQAARVPLEAALASCRRSFDGDHPELANALHNLSGWHVNMHDFETAERYASEAYEMYVRLYPDAHPGLARALMSYGRLLGRLGRVDEGAPLVIRGYEMQEAMLGKDHRHTLRYALGMARALAELGETARADSLLRDNLARRLDTYGEGTEVARTRLDLGRLLRDEGRLDEAVAELEAALAAYRAARGDAHPETAGVLEELAVTLARSGELERARALHQEAMPVLVASFGEDTPRVADARAAWEDAVGSSP